MIDEKKIMKLLGKVDEAGLNDLLAGTYYDQIVEELGNDSGEILRFLRSLDDETLYEVSTIFDELERKFENDELTDELIRMSVKATQAVTRGLAPDS